LFPSFVFAQNDYGAGVAAEKAGLKNTKIAKMGSPAAVIGEVINVGLSFIGIVFFVLVLYAGFTWMTAMGNTEQVTKAKNIIETAIIGLVLVAGAYAIANFVFDRLGASTAGTGGTTPTVDCQITTNDGKSCGDNQVCYQQNCQSRCAAKYISGLCKKPADCNDPSGNWIVEAGLCPGGADNVCCRPK
jgi:hypothetical protein